MHLICQSPPCCSIVKIKARYNGLPLASRVGKLASNAAKLQSQTKVVGKVVQPETHKGMKRVTRVQCS